jgi:hypothetical protein
MAATHDGIAAKFAAIQQRMNTGRPLLNREHYDLYNRLKDKGVPVLDIPTAPEWIRPAFAAAYLRAEATIASGKNLGLFVDPKRVEAVLDNIINQQLEADFAGELVAETMLAAHGDPRFARELRRGADEFRALAAELYGPNGTDRPEALARAVGGGNCICCADTPGGSSCHPCSCWIIVVIIIIIVVGK